MLQNEFEERVKMIITPEEYKGIESLYMDSDLSKDDFCQLWAKLHKKRIAAYNEAVTKHKELSKKIEILFSLKERFNCRVNYTMYAARLSDVLNKSDIKLLNKVNLGNLLSPDYRGVVMNVNVAIMCIDTEIGRARVKIHRLYEDALSVK